MDEKYYPVDNYIGKNKKEVKSKYHTIVFKGEGNLVVDQLPKVGEMVKEGGTIILMLSD